MANQEKSKRLNNRTALLVCMAIILVIVLAIAAILLLQGNNGQGDDDSGEVTPPGEHGSGNENGSGDENGSGSGNGGNVHTHTPATAVKENEVTATCKAGGNYDEVVYCSTCNTELSRTHKTTAKTNEHNPATAVKENEVTATCKAGGSYDEVVYCTVCETELTRENHTTPITDHKFENGKCIYCGLEKTSEGLIFISNGDKTCYVAGIGTCTDADIVIPSVSPDGDAVTSIGGGAFYRCTTLTSIMIPDSVTNIGQNAFHNCDNLTDVYITDTEKWCNISFGNYLANPLNYADNFYLNGNLVTNLVIPDGVTSIGSYAFYGCESLTSVTIPDSVTSIGERAFYGCESLTSVYITDVAKWCNISFFGASYANPLKYASNLYLNGNLVTNLVIPDDVTSISGHAFYGCNSLTSITIPDSVTSIGGGAFSGCYKLVEVINKSTLEITAGSSAHGYVACYAKEVHSGESKIINVDGYLFYTYGGLNYLLGYAGNDTDLTLPKNHNGEDYEIYEYAFYRNSNITSVVIPDSVTNIGSAAFSGCTGLTSATIGNGVTSIGVYAFYNCTSLTSITIPDSVTSIGTSAFYGCFSLESVSIPFVGASINAREYMSHFGYIFGYTKDSNGSYIYHIPTSLKTVVVTSGTSIGEKAFYDCTSLTSITIPNSVTSIRHSAFAGCTGLTSVTIPDSVTSIGGAAFSGCCKLVEVINKSTLDITVGSSAHGYVAHYAKEVHSGESKIINVDGYLFYTYGGLNYLLGYAGNDTDLTLPKNHNGEDYEIYEYAFYRNSNITSVVIPDSVTNIGSAAFSGCTGLTSVTIGNGVTNIGPQTFSSCTALTSVTIPDSVTSIGIYAFYNCTSLTSVTFKDTSGWWVSKSSTATSGTSVSTSSISNISYTSTAATYLKSTYCDYYWKRS